MNNMIDELNKELDELQAKIEEVQKKIEEAKQDEWPKKGDKYWYLLADGYITYDKCGGLEISDGNRWAIGNKFRTEEEAKFEKERLKVIAELKKFAMTREEVNAAHHNITIYGIILNSNTEIEIFDYLNVRSLPLYFESPKIAREAIKAVGEERIRKYYFGVGD